MRRLCIARTLIFSFASLLLTSTAGAASPDLIAYWPFDEARGETVQDASGHGHHGKIHGATFVESPQGHALHFDGVDDFVDCGIRPGLSELEKDGTIEFWFQPEAFQGGLVNWSTGSDWVDQRLVISFKNYHNTDGWIQTSSNTNTYSERNLGLPQKNVWNHVVVTFDGGTVSYYLDGVVHKVFNQDARPHIQSVPLWIGKSTGLGIPFFKGLIDEVSLYRRVLSPLEVLAHYKSQAVSFDKDTRHFQQPLSTLQAMPEPGWIAVQTDFSLLRPLPPAAMIQHSVRDADGRHELDSKVTNIAPHLRSITTQLDATRLPPQTYQIVTTLLDGEGKPWGQPSRESVAWPGQSPAFKNIKILNNVVWELLHLQQETVSGEKSYAFTSPKSRWLYIAATVGARADQLRLSVQSGSQTTDMIVFQAGAPTTQETMRYLPAGAHRLVVHSKDTCQLQNLVLRSIPELLVHEFILEPPLSKLEMSPEEFSAAYVFNNANSFVIAPSHLNKPFFRKWQASGKRWISGFSLPRARGDDRIQTAQDAYQYVADTKGFNHPLVTGSIADEFITSEPHCAIYADAVRELKATTEFKDRVFYAYANQLYNGEEGRELVHAVVDTDSVIAWKHYLPTHSTESVARQFIKQKFVETARKYAELCPGSLANLAICPGNFSLVGGHLLNSTPNVNHKTYLDMQYNIIANDPAYWGTYGLMTYHTSYADEETIRWVSKLFRHYGIAGNTQPASDDPYESPHLFNGDFEEGTQHWQLTPATENSIRTVLKYGISELQTRIKSSEGDTGLVTRRSADGPNTFTQQIQNLRPGQWYTFRMMSCDYDDMSKAEQHAVTIALENATLVPERCVTYQFDNPPWHNYPPYDGNDNKAWITYHWYLFRADASTARVTISDWSSDDQPGGPIGQQLMFNYLQVHPYYPPERQ